MATDQIFRNENRRILDFTFGKETAEVFPDMLERSVPFYSEVQRMIQELAADFGVDDTNVYDLGCSTGTTLHNLDSMPQSVHLVGIDDSPDMIARAESNLAGCDMRHGYTLLTRDLRQGAATRQRVGHRNEPDPAVHPPAVPGAHALRHLPRL